MSTTRNLEEPAPESVVDRRYVLRREIGRGGMGSVFEAEHVVTRAKVAVKTLCRPALDNLLAHARLMREARVLGAVRHPNVVHVQDAGACPLHGPFIVLDMIDGRPLDGILVARQRLDAGQAVALVIQLCDALDAVGRRGIVHRDVKPSNLLISRGGVGDRVHLIDFGIAQVGAQDDGTEEKLTKMGELLGTVEYMSPEQILGKAQDTRTDVYGAGVVLYECLTGEVPLGGSPTAVIAGLLGGQRPPPIRPARADVPEALERTVRRALEIDPAQRFGSALELARACAAALGDAVPPLELLASREDRVLTLPVPAPPAGAAPAEAPREAPKRRLFARAPYMAPVRILEPDGRSVDGRTEDISEGGVLVVSEGAFERERQIKLRMPLPSSGKVVTLDAVTRWVKTHRNQRAYGVEFVDAPEDARADIRSYVGFMTGAPQPIEELPS